MTRARDFLPWALLLFVFSPRARSLVVPRGAPSGLLPVTKVHTGGPSWQADRFAALAAAGISGDMARAIVAHWAFETGHGAGEWNYNVGNLKALPGQQAVDLGVGWFAAYAYLADGVKAYLSLLQMPRYAIAWASLQSAPRSTAWIRQLVAAGYDPSLTPDEYERRYAGTLKTIGEAPA